MTINIVTIVSAASGLIFFNLVLVTCCLCCHRRQELKLELQTIPLQQHSLLKGKSVRFAASVKHSRNKYVASYAASGPHMPSPLSSAKVRTRKFDRPRAEVLLPHKSSTVVPTPTNYALSVYSDDTASVYSAASAPLEIHDDLLRSHNSLNMIPFTLASEVLSKTVTSSRDTGLIFPPEDRPSIMEKGLGREAYNRAIQQPPREVSSSDRLWRQQQSPSRELMRDQSALSQTPNRLFPPGLPPPTVENILSTPMPSPYSPPSKW